MSELYCSKHCFTAANWGWAQLAAAVVEEALVSLVQASQLLANEGRQIQLRQGVILQLWILLQSQMTAPSHACLNVFLSGDGVRNAAERYPWVARGAPHSCQGNLACPGTEHAAPVSVALADWSALQLSQGQAPS